MAIFGIICSGVGGVIITLGYSFLKNRMQVMKCQYIEDDILSKVPLKGENEMIQENLHCKRFRLINTTNQDIKEFKVLFQFDDTSVITDCYTTSKEGYNRQKIRVNKVNKNEAEALVKNFNRKDWIEFTVTVANITNNKYYITETNCIGFKIKCKDKRKDTAKSKSQQSDVVLIKRHH
jgi:hypothetical protein